MVGMNYWTSALVKQLRYTITVRDIQFSPSTLFPLEKLVSTHKLVPFTVGFKPNFITVPHLSGSWSDLIEVGGYDCSYPEIKFVLVIFMLVYCYFNNLGHVCVIWHDGYQQSRISFLLILYITEHVIHIVEHLPGELQITSLFPSCGLSQKPWLLLSSSFYSVPLHFILLCFYAKLLCGHTWVQNVF